MSILSKSLRRVPFVLASCACAAAVALAAVNSAPVRRAERSRIITEREALQGVMRLGLDVEAAAAAGLTPAQLGAALGNGREHFLAQGAGLAQADAAVGEARAALDRTLAEAANGRLGTGAEQAIATARATLQTATTARDGLLAEGLTATAEDLPAETTAKIQTIARNRKRELPVEFLLSDRTDAQWAQLRTAFYARVSQHQAAALGLVEEPATRDPLLTQVEAEAPVIAARLGLASRAELEAVWTQALRDAQ